MSTPLWDWEEIVDHLHSDVLITDASGVILYTNKVIEHFYGMKREEILGRTVMELERERVFYPSVVRKILATKKSQTLIQETKLGHKFLVTGKIIYDDRQQIKFVVTYAHDVTELVNLREYVTQMEHEIQKIRKEMLEMSINKKKREGIIATSPKIIKILDSAEKVSKFNTTILLTGESGVGKNVIAKYIHHQSKRTGALVEINCGSIPDALLESELFGYAPGAFTGANPKGSTGLVEAAQDGTLFLDEIGELPLNLQVKLLTLIQEKKFFRVGENKPRSVDFRLIAATNVELEGKVAAGEFRQDLYFRLSVIPLHIPPLRERQEDLLSMILDFMMRYNHLYNKQAELHQEALNCLLNYSWPGNVRELENMIERLILITDDPVIRKEHLPKHILLEGVSEFGGDKAKTLPELLDEYEANLMKKAYEKCRNTIEMAKYLGISQPTVVRKLKKYKSTF